VAPRRWKRSGRYCDCRIGCSVGWV
jgi:hypothetical protein